jgi:hypothetical protein
MTHLMSTALYGARAYDAGHEHAADAGEDVSNVGVGADYGAPPNFDGGS